MGGEVSGAEVLAPYRISLAVAGFGVNDITLTAEQNVLTIAGKKPEGNARETGHHEH